mmetsp:Transcript_117/g.438  ORF Transcript_117/g.438 Transcript_117/m.438 type:complete len:307 (-) Transcript_117:154-1074(-)
MLMLLSLLLLLLLQSAVGPVPSQRRGLAKRELPPRPLLLRLHLLRMLADEPRRRVVTTLGEKPRPAAAADAAIAASFPKRAPARGDGRPARPRTQELRRLCRRLRRQPRRRGDAGRVRTRVGARVGTRVGTRVAAPPAHARWLPRAAVHVHQPVQPRVELQPPRRGWLVRFQKLAVRSVRLRHDGAAAEAASPRRTGLGPTRANDGVVHHPRAVHLQRGGPGLILVPGLLEPVVLLVLLVVRRLLRRLLRDGIGSATVLDERGERVVLRQSRGVMSRGRGRRGLERASNGLGRRKHFHVRFRRSRL